MLETSLKKLLQRTKVSYTWAKLLTNFSIEQSERWLNQFHPSRICVDWSLRQPDSVLIYTQQHSRIKLEQLQHLQADDCAIILTDFQQLSTNKPVLYTPDLEKKIPKLLLAYFNIEIIKVRLIAVTGTNGKSSIVHFIAQLLNRLDTQANNKVGILSTLGNGLYSDNKPLSSSPLTTLGIVELYEKIAELQNQGAEYLVMEASSHGIHQQRLKGLKFDVVIFSNLSHDHLDYHQDMETYYQVKKKLFSHFVQPQSVAVLNIDDGYGKRLNQELQNEQSLGLITVSAQLKTANIKLQNIQLHSQGSQFEIEYKQQRHLLSLALFGDFQVENIALSIGAIKVLGFDFKTIITKVSAITSPTGRMQLITPPSNNLSVFIDYAHTPDALKKLIATIQNHYGQSTRYICVFGCGGNRDTDKRSKMGEIAATQADIIVITDDNPRDEDAATIRQQIYTATDKIIKAKYPHKQLFEIADRKQAIMKAIQLGSNQKNLNIVIIAGKGHEDYQIISGKRHPFSDIQVAQQILLAIEND